MLRILKVILEGHPSIMLPYPRLSPLIVRLFFEGMESRRSYHVHMGYTIYMLRILEVILEGHPCGMLPYPRLSPFIVLLILNSWSPGDRRMFIWVIPYASHPEGHP